MNPSIDKIKVWQAPNGKLARLAFTLNAKRPTETEDQMIARLSEDYENRHPNLKGRPSKIVTRAEIDTIIKGSAKGDVDRLRMTGNKALYVDETVKLPVEERTEALAAIASKLGITTDELDVVLGRRNKV